MPGLVLDEFLDRIVVGNSNQLISEIWNQDRVIWQFDKIPPELTVTAPAGTSASAPTYVRNSAYTVAGTVFDPNSGVKAVYVNGETVPVNADGTWSKSIALSANVSTEVSVYAIDKAGNLTPVITRYVYYDTVAPSLGVSAPAGTSSSSPTYVQSDSAYNYTVSGTVSDVSGIKSVTVNGVAVTVSNGKWSRSISLATNTTHTITVIATDNSGKTTTVTRYVRIEAYYQYAARIAGTTVQTSLDATLKNSNACAKIAGNATAYGAMAAYKSTITNYINSTNWSEGLNLLAYRCKAKCYLIRGTFGAGISYCSNITGGYTNTNNGGVYADANNKAAFANNQLDFSGYTSLHGDLRFNGNRKNGNMDGYYRFGVSENKNVNNEFLKYYNAVLGSGGGIEDLVTTNDVTVLLSGTKVGYFKIYLRPRYQNGGDEMLGKLWSYNVYLI